MHQSKVFTHIKRGNLNLKEILITNRNIRKEIWDRASKSFSNASVSYENLKKKKKNNNNNNNGYGTHTSESTDVKLQKI